MNKNIIAMLLVIALIGGVILFMNINKGNDVSQSNDTNTNENGVETMTGEYKKITPAQGKKILEENQKAILLDVRTKAEYNDKHIPGSTLLPLSQLENGIEDEVPNKDTEILVYCRSGNRSRTASMILLDMGYTKVYDMGGIIDWPYEVE